MIFLLMRIHCHGRAGTNTLVKFKKSLTPLSHVWYFPLGVFIARGKEDALVTKNIVPGESVYGEKRISVDVRIIILYW